MADLPTVVGLLKEKHPQQNVVLLREKKRTYWQWLDTLQRHVLIGRGDLVKRFKGAKEADAYLAQFPTVTEKQLTRKRKPKKDGKKGSENV